MSTSASIRSIRLLLILFFAIASLYYISQSYSRIPIPPGSDSFQRGGKQPSKPASQFPINPNGNTYHVLDAHDRVSHGFGKGAQRGKMKAAFVSLIRNQELWEIVRSIRQIEDRFNRNYHYPWVFLNDVPFTQEFIDVTSALISGETKYGMSRPEIREGWGG